MSVSPAQNFSNPPCAELPTETWTPGSRLLEELRGRAGQREHRARTVDDDLAGQGRLGAFVATLGGCVLGSLPLPQATSTRAAALATASGAQRRLVGLIFTWVVLSGTFLFATP